MIRDLQSANSTVSLSCSCGPEFSTHSERCKDSRCSAGALGPAIVELSPFGLQAIALLDYRPFGHSGLLFMGLEATIL